MMKKKLLTLTFLSGLLAVLLVFSAIPMAYAMEKSDESDEQSVTTSDIMSINGVIKLVDGEAVIVSSGITYYVNGPDLSEHVERKIAATGTVETNGSEKTVNIDDYELLD